MTARLEVVGAAGKVQADSPERSEGKARAPAAAVTGWASSLGFENHTEPAVIVNPAATPAALLDWAVGQLMQVNVVLDAAATSKGPDGMTTGELAGAVLHFSAQAQAVLVELQARGHEPRQGVEP